MSAADVHRAMFDAVRDRDWDGFVELFHPEYTYIGTDGTEIAGVDAAIEVAQTYTGAFPDLRFEILHQHVVDNRSVIELRASGTHRGPLGGIEPTGRSVVVTGCNVIEVEDGTVRREREYFDTGALMAQLGVGELAVADHRATVQAIYEAFGRGDVDAIIDRLADDVSWDVDIPHWGLPWYEARRGRESVRGFFDVVGKELEFHAFEPVAMMTSDDQLAAMIRFELEVRSTGRRVADTEIHLWTFGDDGKVSRFAHIVDQHAQLLAFRDLQET